MALLCPVLKQRFFDSNGLPLVGGKLYSYDAGTLTPKDTFTDYTGGTPNTNPVILDADGEAEVWLDGAYKFKLTDANDVEQFTVDNVVPGNGEIVSAPYFVESTVDSKTITSGTTSTITGIDPSATKVIILFKNLSVTGSNNFGLAIRLGNGAPITTGYVGTTNGTYDPGNNIDTNTWSGTFDDLAGGSYIALSKATLPAANYLSGSITLVKDDTNGFWSVRGGINEQSSTTVVDENYQVDGTVTFSGDLDRIILTVSKAATISLDGGLFTVVQYANTGSLLGVDGGRLTNQYSSTGTDNYALTLRHGTAPTEYFDGMEIDWTPENTNTSTGVTVNVEGLGPITVVMADGSTVPPIGFLKDTATYYSRYDGILNKLLILLPKIVETDEIEDSAITTVKIDDDAVTTDKILDANVTTAKLADNAVTTVKITDANVTTAKLADSAVTTAKIADGSITLAKFAAASGVLVVAEAGATLSTTKHEVTGLPACNRIDIFVRSQTFDVTDDLVLQLGYGATPTYITTGYVGRVSSGTAQTLWSTAAILSKDFASGDTYGVHVVLQKESGNVWAIYANGLETVGNNNPRAAVGYVDVTAPLTAVKLQSDLYSATFTGGYVTVTYF